MLARLLQILRDMSVWLEGEQNVLQPIVIRNRRTEEGPTR